MPLSEDYSGNERLTHADLAAALVSTKEVTIYLRKSLTRDLLKTAIELVSREHPPRIEIVLEDIEDIAHLRMLYSAGISLFYGLGLPRQTIVFLERRQGFWVEGPPTTEQKLRALKDPEAIYLRLLWCRFGIAVSISGVVSEKLERSDLFCLMLDGKIKQWCRFRTGAAEPIPALGMKVEVFGWQKWNSRVIETLELKMLQPAKSSR